jgi:hypothetical protein
MPASAATPLTASRPVSFCPFAAPLSRPFLLSLFSRFAPRIALLPPFLLLLFAFLLFQPFDLEFLLLDFSLLGRQLLLDPLTLGSSHFRLARVLLVRLSAACLFSSGLLIANLSPPDLADAFLDGFSIDELVDDLGGLVIYAGSLEGAVDQGGSLGSVEREQLVRVPLDFLLGNFEDRFRNLCLVVLCKPSQLALEWR